MDLCQLMPEVPNLCWVERLMYEGEWDTELDSLDQFLYLEEEDNLEEAPEDYTDEHEADTIPYVAIEDQNLDGYEDILEDSDVDEFMN